MDGIHKSIFLWGLICLVGFGVYQYMLMDPGFPQPMILWSVLTVIGVAAMALWVPHWQKNKVVQVWIVVTVLGMLYHWAFALKMLPAVIPNAWAYWAIVMAIGFVLTGHFWKSNFYYGVGVLNAIVFLMIMFTPALVGMYASALLAIVSGIPMMYDGLKG